MHSNVMFADKLSEKKLLLLQRLSNVNIMHLEYDEYWDCEEFIYCGASYIINVLGDFTDPNSAHFNVDQENALFNFEDATKVNLGQWGASILAPDAAVTITGGGNVDGSLFAQSFLGGGELHNNNLFNGALPSSAVPEPSTWAMLFAGFVGLGFLGWHRTRNGVATAA